MLRRITSIAIGCTLIMVGAAADVVDSHGSVVRHNENGKSIWLVFSADSAFEGAPQALDALEARGMKGSFFFTGNFLRDSRNDSIVKRIVDGGHYVGPHSDGHLLYADWGPGRPTLVTPDSLLADMHENLHMLKLHGVDTAALRWFMPPFEWITAEQTKLVADSLGLIVVNPLPGLEVYRDYTTPDMPYYWSSERLEEQLYDFERQEGLNGAIFIMHLGTHPLRTDKFYTRLPAILDSLTILGYQFERLP